MKKTLAWLHERKRAGEKIVMLTAYDYPTAVLEDEAGVDAILVGDSVGPNVLGYVSERDVTMGDIVHHLRAVRRGVQQAYVLADLPCGTYETRQEALANARHLLSNGADGVKLEGAVPDIVHHLSTHGVQVCAHLGHTPQTHERPKLRAKTASTAVQLVEEARQLEQAGAGWIVFELIPEEVARTATERLRIPTIGIGAGRFTDGQVLVVLDLLGITPVEFRHNRRYEQLRDRIGAALSGYAGDVRTGRFPAAEHTRPMAAAEHLAFIARAEPPVSRGSGGTPA
jgi:3-methyl-2-oxobutanoate hydroxymethyltransferase